MSFTFVEGRRKTQHGLCLRLQRGQQRRWVTSGGLSILTDCAMWTLRAGRGTWQLCAVLAGGGGGSRSGGARLRAKGLLWSRPPSWLSLVSEVGAPLTLRWVGAGLPAASDNRTAALTLRAAFLLFLGVENGEDCFIKNRFETFLS